MHAGETPGAARLRSAGHLARRERERHRLVGTVDVESILRALGHTVQVKHLRASVGGLEACVVPLSSGAFAFTCDDAPTPSEAPEVADLPDARRFRVSFRLAHEYAHTLLAPAGRGLRAQHKTDSLEEAACDAFAALLLCDGNDALRATRSGPAESTQLCQRLNVAEPVVRLAAQVAGLLGAA